MCIHKRTLIVGLLGMGVMFGCSEDHGLATSENEITANRLDWRSVKSEWMRPNAGVYRQVMDSSSCTGTVVGPHAVLTAYHCAKPLAGDLRYDGPCKVIGPGRRQFVKWSNDPIDLADDLTMEVTNSFGSPHALNKKYYLSRRLPVPAIAANRGCEYRPYRPTFWGNDTQMPHPHDIAIYFVPALTQQFIDANGIEVGKIDGILLDRKKAQYPPHVVSGLSLDTISVNFTSVGRMAGINNATRRYGNAFLGGSDPSRPGQLPRATTFFDSVHSDAGDSGGPTFGAIFRRGWSTPSSWLSPLLSLADKLSLVFLDRVIVAANKSGSGIDATTATSGPDYTVPLAYLDGMTVEQRESVRLNHLWLRAQIDDADSDGIPIQCDADPAVARYPADLTERCPTPLGLPNPLSVEGYPQGSLMCDEGYVSTAYRGKKTKWGLRRLALKCSPLTCLQNSKSSSCKRSYWTDSYGISDLGTSFTRHCQAGQGIFAFNGRLSLADGELKTLGFTCRDFNNWVHEGFPEQGRTSLVGLSEPVMHSCNIQSFVSGLVVRMVGRSNISGIQAICTP